jgi:hypothetical protein
MGKITLVLSTTILLCLSLAWPALSDDLTEDTTDTPIFSFSGEAHLGIATSKSDTDSDVAGSLRLQLHLEPVKDISMTGRATIVEVFKTDYTDDDYYLIDRLFLSWNNIADSSFSLLAGRLPSMEGAPDHLRLGLDTPRGIFSNYMDIALDGAMLTYGYKGTLPGTVRLFYGSQFDIGYEGDDGDYIMEDTDIYGINWDLFSKENRLVTLQAFVFDNIYNFQDDVIFPNPYELAILEAGWDPTFFGMNSNGILDRHNLGDIYITSLGYLDRLGPLNFFINAAWSHTDPTGVDEMGLSLLNDSWNDPQERDGYSLYTGLRYDLTELHSKIGMEYNYASEYWINFSQSGSSAKLNTRGSVLEGYLIFSPPLPQPTADYIENLFIRLSYQHYWYDYTYSGMWLGTPEHIDDLLDDPMYAQFYAPEDEEYILHLSIDIYF